jgi:Cu(I)/Ag(I) efflux system membrane fusion protein
MSDIDTAKSKCKRLGRFLSTRGGWVVVAGVSLLLGMLLHAAVTPSRPINRPGSVPAGDDAQAEQVWTCSMHPQVRSDEPGLCPICNMDLIPAEGGGPSKLPELTTSATGAALMDVRTAPAQRRYVTAEVRMVGKVDYDETKLAYITAWVPGRLDRLYVDNTGVPVAAGEHLAEIYSPELLAAQEEFLQAHRAVENLPANGGGIVVESTRATLEAAREKLRLLGVSQAQVQQILQQGQAGEHITITSPVGGIVVDKHAREGMYVETGMRIYTVADLSQVWVQLDAYESDLAWLRYGQEVELATVAYPGETFEGTISLIHPVLDAGSRTVSVRVNVPNPDGRLKPGMFVRAVAQSRLARGGQVMDPDLAGKYICTMHPSVIRAEAGDCPECGMDLVRTESLGYVTPEEAAQAAPLVIPASAALVTGKRAVVYVKIPDAAEPTFAGRTIQLGPRAGEWYIVEAGLDEGEEVAVRGNFLIDSAVQLENEPSMMSPQSPPLVEADRSAVRETPAAVPEAVREEFAAILEAYFQVQSALAADDLAAAQSAAEQAAEAVDKFDGESLPAVVRGPWADRQGPLRQALQEIASAEQIEPARAPFSEVSEQLAVLARQIGGDRTLYLMRCPMAFNNAGARWLQLDATVANPYFGAAMLRCGAVVEEIAPVHGEEGGHVHD